MTGQGWPDLYLQNHMSKINSTPTMYRPMWACCVHNLLISTTLFIIPTFLQFFGWCEGTLIWFLKQFLLLFAAMIRGCIEITSFISSAKVVWAPSFANPSNHFEMTQFSMAFDYFLLGWRCACYEVAFMLILHVIEN